MTPLGTNAPVDWLEHGFTAKLRRYVEGQQEFALAALIATCRKSEDPEVVRRLTEYVEIGSFLVQLGKVNANGTSDRTDGDE